MKILRVIPSMNPVHGGPCQGIRYSIPGMKKLGVYNEVVSMDNPGESFLGNDPFIIHAIGKSSGPWKYNPGLLHWLLKNLQRFDVVIIHGLWLYHSYAVNRAVLKMRKNNEYSPRVLVMPHGMLDPWFQQAAGRKIKAIRNTIYWRFIEKNVINNSDGVLFTSKEELKLAKKTFPSYKPRHELNAGYGILPPPGFNEKMRDSFLKQTSGITGKKYLLYLSRIDIKKGVDLLIKSYRHCRQEFPGLPYLVIAGPGLDSPFGKSLRALAGNDDHIIFPGMLTGAAKWGAIYGCEAFILPSHQENFGIAVAEALACGKPVLISRKINIWQDIIEQEAGYAEEVSAEGITLLIKKWIRLDGAGRKDMGENAGLLFRNKFTADQAARQMLHVIKEIT